MKSTKDWT